MTVTVTLSVAAGAFPLGDVFRALPNAQIELDRVVPSGEALLPYVWVSGEDADTDAAAIRTAIAASDHVQRVEVLDSLPDRTLVRIEWAPTVDGLITAITEQEAAILSASGDADRWRLELRFPTSAAASAFQQACRDAGVRVSITGVYDTTEGEPDRSAELTSDQHEALELALEWGYFDVPRRTTLVDLAAELGISDSAVSERLRRAQTTLAAAYFGK